MTEFEQRNADWLSYEEALARILSRARPLPLESVGVSDALGRSLAEGIRSPVTLPQHDNSAMDGYAVRSDDVVGASREAPVTLGVAGISQPGAPWAGSVASGQAVRVMTGGPIPKGCDGVIRVEDTDREESEPRRVRIFSDRDHGRHIRPRGEDIQEGEEVLPAGRTVDSGALALLSAVGADRIRVTGRPRVALLSTGDEIVGPEAYDDVRAGRAVPDTNGPALRAGVEGAGGTVTWKRIVPDETEALAASLEEASRADVLVTIGGASMGEYDLVKRVLDRMGFRLAFWRIRVRPGTPFSFGLLPTGSEGGGDTPVFGLPGNPVSAFVTFHALVRPFLLQVGGHQHTARPMIRGISQDQLRSPAGFTTFSRVRVEASGGTGPSRWAIRLTGPQGSGLVSSLGRADGLAVVPEESDGVVPGEEVDVVLLGDGPGWPGSRPAPG